MHVICAADDVIQFLSLFRFFQFLVFYPSSYGEREVTDLLAIMVKIVVMVMIT